MKSSLQDIVTEAGVANSRLGDILETNWSPKTPRPETAEIPAVSGLGFDVPDGIQTAGGRLAARDDYQGKLTT